MAEGESIEADAQGGAFLGYGCLAMLGLAALIAVVIVVGLIQGNDGRSVSSDGAVNRATCRRWADLTSEATILTQAQIVERAQDVWRMGRAAESVAVENASRAVVEDIVAGRDITESAEVMTRVCLTHGG